MGFWCFFEDVRYTLHTHFAVSFLPFVRSFVHSARSQQKHMLVKRLQYLLNENVVNCGWRFLNGFFLSFCFVVKLGHSIFQQSDPSIRFPNVGFNPRKHMFICNSGKAVLIFGENKLRAKFNIENNFVELFCFCPTANLQCLYPRTFEVRAYRTTSLAKCGCSLFQLENLCLLPEWTGQRYVRWLRWVRQANQECLHRSHLHFPMVVLVGWCLFVFLLLLHPMTVHVEYNITWVLCFDQLL